MNELEIKIIEYFTKSKKKISYEEILEKLEITEDNKILKNVLDNLEYNGVLYCDKHDLYTLFPNELIQGRLKIDKKGNYYVTQNNSFVFIDSKYLNGALENDLVVVKSHDYKIQGKLYGSVNKVVSRSNEKLIFEYSYSDGKYFYKPVGFEFNYDIDFHDNKKIDVVGTRVSVSISKSTKNGKFIGKINDIIGYKDDPDYICKMMAICNGFDIDFSKEAKVELESIPNYVRDFELENRVDLRDKTIFTIDGKNTKDMDDAISLTKNENGNYILGVHIADVSHYVKPESFLYKEAFKRGTSLYLVDSVIPMLPHKLSNGICSLNEGVDRLTKTCEMEITPTGNIVNYKIFDSVINSKKKMSYEDVNDILDNNVIKDDYKIFINDLKEMEKLSKILSNIKKDRGYICFNDDDVVFETNEIGEVVNIKGRNRGTSEEMIENFMLLANEMVASTYITLPFVYRVHPSPSAAALKEILEYISTINKSIRISRNFNSPKVIQGLLNKTNKLKEKDIISDAILRAMKKASYSCDNIGHFGLSLSNYTHFTSPIRRFPDLMVHTLINKYNSYFDVNALDDLYAELKKGCANSSYKEKQAELTERQINKYKMAEFMGKNIGNTFSGYIYYVSSNHLTIKLDNMVVGKISINDIDNNPYYEPSTNCIITDTCAYKIGCRITVTVKNADKDTGTVSFSLEKQKVKVKA